MKKWQGSLLTVLLTIWGIGSGLVGTSNAVEAQTVGGLENNNLPIEAKTMNKQSSENENIPFQILGINDFHGALNTTGSFFDDEGKKIANAGTAPLLAGYLNRAQEQFALKNNGAQTLRVQAGDMVGASPASSGLLQDEPTIKVLNQMDFSVGTLGNHEFDEGLQEFNRIMIGGKPLNDPYGILTAYPREASKTQIVIGNVVKKGTEEIPFNWKPYTIKEVGPTNNKVKVGFIGVVTTEIPNLVLKEHYEGYDFLDEAETIAYYSSKLKEEGVNAIIVLAHIPATSKAEKVNGEAAEIIDRVNEIYPENSVDAFFAAHNHQYTNGVVNKTRVVQSTAQGKGYIDLQGILDPETKDFIETPKASVLPVDPAAKDVPKVDANVEATVKDAEERVATVTNKKIGTAKENGVITREVNEAKESPLGNLITDGQVAMAKAQGINADFAMTNNGGIRADLAVEENRDITWGAAQAVQPFGNIMQVVEMTGSQIEQVLNEQYDEEERYFLQISGLNYTYVATEDKEQPFKVHEMFKADGTPIQADQTYLVVINDFLFGGGDGFSAFTGANLVNAIQPDTETFIGYIESQEAAGKMIAASVENRKKLVDPLRPTDPQVPDPSEGEETLKRATIFDPLYEDDELLRGVTLPNATIVLYDGELPETKTRTLEDPKGDLVEQADSEGRIKINVTSLKIKGKKLLTAIVSDLQGNKAVFQIEILPKKEVLTEVTKPKDLSESGTKKELPKTGEQQSISTVLFGLAVISATFVVLSKRKFL
ncbi:bifunctional metallophosphatase/5'-nucleotidase [Enterococcus silesiacus]|uniref:Bifunctional metallophosphatase/5'-nucleotidase n=1 Tax=Enterococcus silesiacus TaxID=332949 RepID=A0A0S3K9B6_9ENTE|nr:5'-nucleotidase C-terminal domain-containing protein [Enterococcus silesiacus]ALS00867.1 bifunctional metallophosphatase/5'-nucleotidase [Enterococcus silesiacus]OJG91609.1 LPXTG-domain-containing protein cell wall anchor domain [Enterococcus silesiacus]